MDKLYTAYGYMLKFHTVIDYDLESFFCTKTSNNIPKEHPLEVIAREHLEELKELKLRFHLFSELKLLMLHSHQIKIATDWLQTGF